MVLKPKEPVTIKLNVYEADELTTSKRRYSGWVPAIPIIAGAAILGGGIAMNFVARDTMAQFERQLEDDCDISSTQPSCPPSNDATDLNEQAELFQIISIAGMATGGAAIATGLVLLSLQPQKHLSPHSRRARAKAARRRRRRSKDGLRSAGWSRICGPLGLWLFLTLPCLFRDITMARAALVKGSHSWEP